MVTKPTGQNYPSNTRNSNGLNYNARSILYDDGGSTYRVGADIQTTNGAVMKLNSVGLMPQLISSTGRVIATAAGKLNNTEESYFNYIPDRSYGASGAVACLAWVSFDGGYRYDYRLHETNVAGYSRSADWEAQIAVLAETTLTEDGAYPVNAAGETYGSVLLADMAGQNPDLVSATNQKGVDGYIRIADVPTIDPTVSVAAVQMIPLYDMNGNVIGSFEIDIPESTGTEAVQSVAG